MTEKLKYKQNTFKQLGKVRELSGTIIQPEVYSLSFVLSPSNLNGDAKANFLLPLFNKKWKKVGEDSRGWFVNKTGEYKLGAVNTTAVQSDVWVLHVLCQDENLNMNAGAFEKALKSVAKMALYEKASVHISLLFEESLPELRDLVKANLVDAGVNVYFYKETVKDERGVVKNVVVKQSQPVAAKLQQSAEVITKVIYKEDKILNLITPKKAKPFKTPKVFNHPEVSDVDEYPSDDESINGDS